MSDNDLIKRGDAKARFSERGLAFVRSGLDAIPAVQADYEARILSALTTGKEVMPNDDGNSNARPATSPGVTAGAVSPDVAALVEAVRALRDAMHNNIVVNDEPHTVVLPDGSRHSGPVVDFLHALLGAQISVLDAALARVKGETK